MNLRIRELADKVANIMPAGVYNIKYDSGKSGVEFTEDALEKFAELIVRKCMDVAKYHTPDTEECEYTWLIHNKIAKHFGVEQ